MIAVIFNTILSGFEFQKQMWLNYAITATRDVVFYDLRENERSESFKSAFRTDKVDNCGHFAPLIEVSTTFRSRDKNLQQSRMGVARSRVFPSRKI